MTMTDHIVQRETAGEMPVIMLGTHDEAFRATIKHRGYRSATPFLNSMQRSR
ncbi:MAG: hypothetical protein KDJ36_06880 [Hyphomicrobiaceae bacterium]|nr:hypothetical protein [Hyphomicrobiaceae bacterium]